jgi:hypothetical protein
MSEAFRIILSLSDHLKWKQKAGNKKSLSPRVLYPFFGSLIHSQNNNSEAPKQPFPLLEKRLLEVWDL